MADIDIMSVLGDSTQRDYLVWINDPYFPKAKAAELAKRLEFDYRDCTTAGRVMLQL